VRGDQGPQAAQARVGDLGVAQQGLDRGAGQVEHRDGQRPGRRDPLEPADGQLDGSVHLPGCSGGAVAAGQQPAVVDDQDAASGGVGRVDEGVQFRQDGGQRVAVGVGVVDGGVVQDGAAEAEAAEGRVDAVAVAGVVSLGQGEDPFGGDAGAVQAEDEADAVLQVVVPEDQRPAVQGRIRCAEVADQGHGFGDGVQFRLAVRQQGGLQGGGEAAGGGGVGSRIAGEEDLGARLRGNLVAQGAGRAGWGRAPAHRDDRFAAVLGEVDGVAVGPGQVQAVPVGEPGEQGQGVLGVEGAGEQGPGRRSGVPVGLFHGRPSRFVPGLKGSFPFDSTVRAGRSRALRGAIGGPCGSGR
jgi:hypothetical protein